MVQDGHGFLKVDVGAKKESLTPRLGYEIEHLGILIAEVLSKLDYCNSLGSLLTR